MDRMVIITVDTLAEILKDYLGEAEIPKNAQVAQLLVKPSEQGRFAVVLESDGWKQDMPALVADFQVKRFFGVGNGI